MDGVSLDGLLEELRPRVVGRHVRRVQALATALLLIELTSERGSGLVVCADLGRAVLCWADRDLARWLCEDQLSGGTRHALLSLRKALEGARIEGLERVSGERTVALSTTGGLLALRFSGAAPSAALGLEGRLVAALGDGPAAWPLPLPRPEREWSALQPEALASHVEEARSGGRSLARAVLAACPSLGPGLARRVDGSAAGFARLQASLRAPRPTLSLVQLLDQLHDRDLGSRDAAELLPVVWDDPRPRVVLESWNEAIAQWLRLRTRGLRFQRRQRELLSRERRHIGRTERLLRNLENDRTSLPDAGTLRRDAEALLASDPTQWPGWTDQGRAAPQDPRDAGRVLDVVLDPGLDVPGQADRLYARARRVEAARLRIEERIVQTGEALRAGLEREGRLAEACDLTDLPASPSEDKQAAEEMASDSHGPRRFLTSRGLEIVVGRGARENHEITFSRARPNDIWLHARDRPGAHVILRDPEGRAGKEDEREAAEVAAFFSDGGSETSVDVHVTRRKFVLPVRGTPGRVRIAHSEVRRVTPRDPTGRLRRR